MISEIVKEALVPGSIEFLLLGLIVGVVLLYTGSRRARWGRAALTALSLSYFVLAMPTVSAMLVRTLQTQHAHLERPSDGKGAAVVVVVGAGVVSYEADGRTVHQLARRTTFAMLEAVRVFKLIGASWIIASGGIANPLSQTQPESTAICEELVRLGIPRDRILLESASRNTAEQVANVAQLLREYELPGAVVFAVEPAQSRRVMLLAEKHNLRAVPAIASALRYDRGQTGWRRWRPSADALRGSESAMYEYLALARAWRQPPAAATREAGRPEPNPRRMAHKQ
jgi:uncharacterized SAM-binding protein YcdF (DUF218 family)